MIRLMEPTRALIPPHSVNLVYSPGLMRYILPLKLEFSKKSQFPPITLQENMWFVWNMSITSGQSSTRDII